MKKYVSWRRVSTFKQSKSGLGLEAQREIIRYFVEREGGEIIADYAECYTGTELSGCVELRKAMQHAKSEGAVLVIAKSDRFRNTVEALQVYEEMGEGNIMFCDLPHTDKFTLTLFFALAEREALIVGIRTKQALDAKKRQGAKLGGANEKYIEARRNKTQEVLDDENKRRGDTKNRHHLESRETKAFIKILRSVFGDVCKSDPHLWEWWRVNTKGDNKTRILSLMRDYNDLDDTLFKSWDFKDLVCRKNQVRLAGMIATLKRSCERYVS